MKKNILILLVEDNHRDEALSLRALKKTNLIDEIIVTRNGIEAVDYLYGTGIYTNRDLSEMPRFILLDLKLPKMNGFQVLQKIREDERTKHLPVIIFTSSTEEQDLINCYNLGANSYIQKPLDFMQFSETIRNIGFNWLMLNKTVFD